MKTVCAEGGLTLKVETPAAPLLALDTYVLIELGKVQSNTGRADQRAAAFLQAARKKVEDGKLLCFETNQREEYLGSPDSVAIAAASLALTRGLRSHTGEIVFNNELGLGIRAFLAGEKELKIPLDARFDLDPDSVAQSPRGTAHRSAAGLIPQVAVISRGMKPIDVATLKNIKKGYAGLDYRQARLRELRALAIRFVRGPMSDADAMTYLNLWKEAGGVDSRSLAQFLTSPYCIHFPKSEIEAELFADVMVSDQPVESGDLHDVGHLSIALPIATFALTDGRMRDRVQRLGLDRRWAVEVFSLKTLNGLVQVIEQL